MHPVFQKLRSDEFFAQVGFASTPSALRRILQENKAVQAVRNMLESQVLNENEIREFAERLMDDFEPTFRFPHEMAIAALAVALETRGTDFAEEFITDLANLQIAEMSMATRVGKLCQDYRRKKVTKTQRNEIKIDLEWFHSMPIVNEEFFNQFPGKQGTIPQLI